MQKLIQKMLLLIMLLFANTVFASEISEKSIHKLIILCGIDKQISKFPELIQLGFEQAIQKGAPITNEKRAQIQSVMVDSFQPKEIISTLEKEIANNMTESDVRYLMAWYESDLGKKITQAEENASTPNAYQEIIKTSSSLLMDSKRVKFAKKMDKLLSLTDTALQFKENTMVAVVTAVLTMKDPNHSVNIEALKYRISENEQKMREETEKIIVASLVYSYKNIDENSLKKYLDFLKRSKAQKFYKTARKGMDLELNHSVDKMAKSLAVLLTLPGQK